MSTQIANHHNQPGRSRRAPRADRPFELTSVRERVYEDVVAGRAQNAHRSLADAAYGVTSEIIRRSGEPLSGSTEDLGDRFIVLVGGQRRGPLGSFSPKKWLLDSERLHEINLNADRRCGHPVGSRGEDMVITIAHELAHLWCFELSIADTSNRGRYHNKRFAAAARRFGCVAVRPAHGSNGFITPALDGDARRKYRDLIELMNDALRLSPASQDSARLPQATSPTVAATPTTPSKYVFASCECTDGRGRRRTLRIAVGWWPLGNIWCETCRTPFMTTETQPNWSSSGPGESGSLGHPLPVAPTLAIAADIHR